MPIKRIPAGAGYEQLTEAATSEYGQLLELVRQAVQDKVKAAGGSEYSYVSLQGIYADRAIASTRGRLYSYPYTLGADNAVTVGEPSEVVASYTPVREAVAAGEPGAAGTFREAADGSIAVTLIRAGASLNGNYYPDRTLQDAVALFEGVRVFSKSDDTHTKGGGKDVHHLLGGVYDVTFVAGASADSGALVGTFRPIDPTDSVVTKMTEAVKRGMQSLMGLSIDATAYTKKVKRGGQTVREAQRFAKVNSVDLIVEPGAGGALDRLTEAAADPDPNDAGESMSSKLKQRLYEAIQKRDPARAKTIDIATISDDELIDLHEAVVGTGGDAAGAGAAAGAAGAGAAAAATTRLTEAQQGRDAPLTRADLEQHAARNYATVAISSSTLPAPAKQKLREHYATLARYTEADVDKAITNEREYLARMTESGRPIGGLPRVEVGDRRTVIAEMLDAFFDPGHKEHRNVRSFRECYREITGDWNVTGQVDQARLTESVGTDTFANALGNSMTRRMQQAYRDAVAWDSWKAVVNVVPVNDFRVQERTQIGGFGDLPVVAERGGYTTLSDPSDAKATYAVAKRGALVQVTMEAIKNDDVGAISRMPVELGRAAKRTLYKFVFNNFFANNPVGYDGLALYHASHGNLFTGAFSAAQVTAHRLAMKKQPGRDTGSRMEIGPRFLLVSDDLEEQAVDMFRRNTNNDKTFAQSLTLDIIPVTSWTDPNDWCTVADPLDIPVVEIGFLDGNEEPVLLTQDNPLSGSVFTNDVISYKERHIYGGTPVVDGWKGTTKAVVP